VGATDKFQGTGVYSGIKMEREKKDEATSAASKLEGDKKTTSTKKK
jgi:hypothetical protein